MTTTVPSLTEERQAEGVRLHRIIMGYLSSKAVFAAVELGVFDALEQGPCTAEELGSKVGLEGRPARQLLLALLGEDLIRRDGDRYANNDVSSTFLVSDSPTSMGPLIAHQNTHFGKFARLTEALRENQPVRTGDNYSGMFAGAEDWARQLAAVTQASAWIQAEGLAKKATLTGHRHLVDLGCGSGGYSIALARANPDVRITAVDQPAVAEVARKAVEEAGLSGQVTVRPANVFVDTFHDCDVAMISHVLEGFEPERARGMIEHVYGWLPDGGELLMHTHTPERSSVPFPYMLGLILVVNNTQGGEVYGERISRRWMEEAGFRDVQVTAVSPISAIFRGTK